MPSKGKKSAKPDCSRTPSTPASARGLKSSSSGGDDERRHQSRLSQASVKYPDFIGESAFVGRVSDRDSDTSKGNQARVWLSEAAMTSSSLAPGSLVSVSFPASSEDSVNFPLENLAEGCAHYFHIDIGDDISHEAGTYFAVATVFPCPKVTKNGVRLSWGLSCTTGFPVLGRSIFVFPVRVSDRSTSKNDNACVCLQHCSDLYLNLVPPRAVSVSSSNGVIANDVSTVSDSVTRENGILASPKTPYQLKLTSPRATPDTPKPDLARCSDVSSVRLALADEKACELLEDTAARWLHGRYLLKGNIVAVPLIFGQICPFQVGSAGGMQTADNSENLLSELKQSSFSPEEASFAYLVGAKTDVYVSDTTSSTWKAPNKASFLEKDCKAIGGKEAGAVPKLGGLSKESAALTEVIMFSLVNKGPFPRYKGVLLHGPPGTGKTSLASYCAISAGVSLYPINGPEIIGQYYGESEQALHDAFDSARKAAPAVVFIDELDAIAPARKDGGEELSLRMVTTLLKLMDEIKRDDKILVIGATNRPDSIDPAMRRPGRLDREIEIGPPSPEQRLEILHTLLSEMDHLLSNTEVQALALETHGFVGADLAALCNEAAMTALRRHVEFMKAGRQLASLCLSSEVHENLNGSCNKFIDSLSSSEKDPVLKWSTFCTCRTCSWPSDLLRSDEI